MSDDTKCDVCGKSGRRRRFYPCPAKWWYLETADDEDPEEVMFTYACSLWCIIRILFKFKRGPGPRFT